MLHIFKRVTLNNSLQRSTRSHFSPNNEDSRSQSFSHRAAFEENRLPGDNLINQLSVISTPNHSCRRQIAFPSSSLGPREDKSEGVCLITQMPPCSAPDSSLLTELINVCVSECVHAGVGCGAWLTLLYVFTAS